MNYVRMSSSVLLLLCLSVFQRPIVAQDPGLALPPVDESLPDPTDAAKKVAQTFTSATNIIFDCSGSMGLKDVASKAALTQQRGIVCITALENAVSKLQGNKNGIGLMLFGHRSFWTQNAEGEYKVQLSKLGEEQKLDTEEVDPSFDVNQELEIGTATKQQVADFVAILKEVKFHRGAQSPCFQALDKCFGLMAELPATVTRRQVVVLMDGYNQLADADAAANDVTLEDLSERVSSESATTDSVPVNIHFVLFGKDFEKNNDGEFVSSQAKSRVELLTKLATDSGGSLQTAVDRASLDEALDVILASDSSKRPGKIVGEIQKNKTLVSGSSEFKVSLEGGDVKFKPVTTTDGKFVFEKVPTGVKYTIKITGRIRNRTYEAEQKDVEASTKSNPEPVSVSLD